MSVGILSLGTATGKYKYSIDEYCDLYRKKGIELNFIQKSLDLIDKLRVSSGIKSKYLSFDMSKPQPSGFVERNKIAYDASWDMAKEAILKANVDYNSITHVVSSTSTVHRAAAMDAEIISKLGLNSNTKRYSLQAMGCTGGGAALTLALSLARENKNSKILLLAIDICSPHMYKDVDDPNEIVSSILFGDGAAAVVIGSDDPILKYEGDSAYTPPDTLDSMNITIENIGLRAGLSRTIDKQISGSIENLLNQLPPLESPVYLFHPGGKSIINALEDKLSCDVSLSRQVLEEYSNMSAPTIFFVIEKYLQSGRKNETLECCCFGQGLHMVRVRLHS